MRERDKGSASRTGTPIAGIRPVELSDFMSVLVDMWARKHLSRTGAPKRRTSQSVADPVPIDGGDAGVAGPEDATQPAGAGQSTGGKRTGGTRFPAITTARSHAQAGPSNSKRSGSGFQPPQRLVTSALHPTTATSFPDVTPRSVASVSTGRHLVSQVYTRTPSNRRVPL